jgi:hypothetical protein
MASYLSRIGTVCTRGIGGEGKGRWLWWFGASWAAIYSSIPSSALFIADVDAGLVASTDFSIEAALFAFVGLASSSASLSGRGRLRDPSLLEDGISFSLTRGNWPGGRSGEVANKWQSKLAYALIFRVKSQLTAGEHHVSYHS